MSTLDDIRTELEECFGLCKKDALWDYVHDDLEEAFGKSRDAVRTLLAEIDRQQDHIANLDKAAALWIDKYEEAELRVSSQRAVIDAADEVFNEAEYYPDAGAYLVSQHVLDAMLNALDAVKPLPTARKLDAPQPDYTPGQYTQARGCLADDARDGET